MIRIAPMAAGRALLGLTIVSVVVIALLARPAPETGSADADPHRDLRDFAADLNADDRYADPSDDEVDAARTALARLLAQTPDSPGVARRDSATGRDYRELRWSTPGAPLVLVDDARPVRLLVEVPHTGSDLRSEEIGVEVFRAVPGSVLLVAGAHRRAADRAADVAHNPRSLFHVLAGDLGAGGLLELQIHGFHDDTAPGVDAVLSPGAGVAGPWISAVADAIEARGITVCRAWRQDCGPLAGRTNAQGRAAASAGRPFLHLELSRTTREDVDRRAAVVDAIAESPI